MKVTYVVPCLNGEKTLKRCLQSIHTQLGNFEREIFFVNNGSTDTSIQIAKSFSATIIHEKQPGAAAARNAGLFASESDYVAFIDCDVELDPSWTNVLLQKLDQGFDAAQGQIIPSFLGVKPTWLESYRYEAARRKTRSTFLNLVNYELTIPLINTSACLMRTSAVKAVGGFDTGLHRSEDAELSEVLFNNGSPLIGETGAVARVFYDKSVFSYLCRSFKQGYWSQKLQSSWGRSPISLSQQLRYSKHELRSSFAIINRVLLILGSQTARLIDRDRTKNRSVVRLQLSRKHGAPKNVYGRQLAHDLRILGWEDKLFLNSQNSALLLRGPFSEAFLAGFGNNEAQLNDVGHELMTTLRSNNLVKTQVPE